jgi:uncharacterized spore protein YtfJ
MAELFLLDSSITAVICANDMMALGALSAAAYSRPYGTRDLFVAGYDRTEIARRELVSSIIAKIRNSLMNTRPTCACCVTKLVNIVATQENGDIFASVDQVVNRPDDGLIFKLKQVVEVATKEQHNGLARLRRFNQARRISGGEVIEIDEMGIMQVENSHVGESTGSTNFTSSTANSTSMGGSAAMATVATVTTTVATVNGITVPVPVSMLPVQKAVTIRSPPIAFVPG